LQESHPEIDRLPCPNLQFSCWGLIRRHNSLHQSFVLNRAVGYQLREASIFYTALKPPRDSSRPEMSAADWTIKINPRAGIKFFPFQSNWDRGIEIYDF
jgi:hypothetical protein